MSIHITQKLMLMENYLSQDDHQLLQNAVVIRFSAANDLDRNDINYSNSYSDRHTWNAPENTCDKWLVSCSYSPPSAASRTASWSTSDKRLPRSSLGRSRCPPGSSTHWKNKKKKKAKRKGKNRAASSSNTNQQHIRRSSGREIRSPSDGLLVVPPVPGVEDQHVGVLPSGRRPIHGV